MKIVLSIITVVVFILFLNSCKSEAKKGGDEKTKIDSIELTPGPIQHEDLTEDQLIQIKSIHQTFEEVYPITLEETIINFKRDLNINNEINIWLTMKETFHSVLNKKEYKELEKRKEVFKVVLMRTMMSKSELKRSLEIKELSESDVDFILNEFETHMNK